MNPTVELVLKHKKANMRKSELLMLEALKSAPHLNDSRMGLTICHTDEFVQSHFSDGNLNPISNPTPP